MPNTRHRSLHSRRGMLAGAAFAAGALLLAVPAFACTGGAQISLDVAKGATGSAIIVTGSQFDPDEAPVSLRWGSAQGEQLAAAPVDVNGDFSQQVTVPADAEAGWHAISAVQLKSDGSGVSGQGTGVIEVVAPAGAPEPEAEQPVADSGQDAPAPAAQPEPAADGGQDAPAPDSQPDPVADAGKNVQPETPAKDAKPEPAADAGKNVQPETPAKDAKPEPVADAGKNVPPDAPARQPVAAAPADQHDAAPVTTTDTSATADQVTPDTAPVPAAPQPVRPILQQPAATAPQGNGLIDIGRAPSLEVPDSTARGPITVPQGAVGGNATLGAPPQVPVGPSPWLLVPLSVLGLGLFSFGAATGISEIRSRRLATSSTGAEHRDQD